MSFPITKKFKFTKAYHQKFPLSSNVDLEKEASEEYAELERQLLRTLSERDLEQFAYQHERLSRYMTRLRYRVNPSVELIDRFYAVAVDRAHPMNVAAAELVTRLLRHQPQMDKQQPKRLDWRPLYDALRAFLFASNHELNRDSMMIDTQYFHALLLMAKLVHKYNH